MLMIYNPGRYKIQEQHRCHFRLLSDLMTRNLWQAAQSQSYLTLPPTSMPDAIAVQVFPLFSIFLDCFNGLNR